MSELLPEEPALRIEQHAGAPSRKALAALDHLLVVLPYAAAATAWQQVPEGARLRRQLEQLGKPAARGMLRSRLGSAPDVGVTVACLPDSRHHEDSSYARLKWAAGVMAEVLGPKPRTLGILVAGLPDGHAPGVAQALLLAAGAAAFSLPDYRRRRPGARRLRLVQLFGPDMALDLQRTLVEIEAANLVRWLTALPPNKLTAGGYRALLAQLSEHHDWSMRFLDGAALRQLGAGAFLAVAQGSGEQGKDAGIVHLAHRPATGGRPDVALVGKGILFDTGGTNLKPFRAMLDMHHDMCGSAVALATLLAVTRLRLPLAVDCWLAITENRIGPQAYKSRDVVQAADGTSIEVIHTDAEGRMALADTLALAAREKPGLILDYATLTGQCINALTERYSGVFTNRPALNDLLVATGRDCGERVWPFPMDEDFDEELKSEVADVLQCSPENEGDHILAARFLQRFVPATQPWIHLDLSSATRKKGLGQVPAGPTGFGVRFTLNLLVDRQDALAAQLAARRRAG